MIRILSTALFIACSYVVLAQSFWFGPRAGLDLNFQRWNNAEQQTLIAPHLSAFIETYDPDSPSSFYASLGYHTRGSAVNYAFFDGFDTNAYRFNNFVVALGAKRKLNMWSKNRPYYILGARAEYTINTNLSDYENITNAVIHPTDIFVRKLNYGLTLGGGFETTFSGLVEGFIEFAIHPDVSLQYDQPPLSNIVVTTFNGTRRVNLAARQIRNLSFEITVGVKLLRLVEYID